MPPDDVREGLARALDGGAPLVLVAAAHALPHRLPSEAALVLETSGSTSGTPRPVALTAAAVRASATATHAALGGPGAWLLTLPAHHVAGVMVTARALIAGSELTVAAPGPFRAGTFADDVARHLAARDDARATDDGAPPRSYTSLVPTQLRRVLDDPRALAAAASFDAVLVGGAATPGPLLDRARAAGVRVVTTYGMTETSGGCVYDGVPLAGVRVSIDDGGRIVLAGPQLALGYLTPDGLEAFDGSLVTADRGTWDGHHLRVLGRADDVVLTGGVNVDPVDVETVAATVPGVAEVCVTGVPDAEWGAVVVAALVPTDAAVHADPARRDALVAAVQDVVRARLGGPWVPRRVVVLDALPLRGPGKPDRAAVRALLPGSDRHLAG
ncbi:O-succinylbenzoic acid--CoA ligase [Serinibacter arcticus]|uniref:O-succinylbenzoic acid--CoA ligase n=1 Tax=Serinibacter arcticus TaxID=1655435 RepID=A0A4Z1E6E5_9MICO|nr:O-succinylbenzoic acid--CoA ligase [Serinibacter arcticus]